MNYLLDFLPDTYLKQMAEHFASLRPPFPPPAVPTVSNEILERGETIATQGDPQRGIPPCASCHGSTFGGNPLATAIGSTVVDMLTTGEFQRRSTELGVRLQHRLRSGRWCGGR